MIKGGKDIKVNANNKLMWSLKLKCTKIEKNLVIS